MVTNWRDRLSRIEDSLAALITIEANVLTSITALTVKIDVLTERITNKYGVGETFQEQEPRQVESCEDIQMVEVIEDSKVVCVEKSVVQEENHVDQEADHKKKDTIEVEDVDFVLPNSVFGSKATSNFVLVSMLFPQIVLKKYRLHEFCWNVSPTIRFIILRYFKTRGRVFFKGEENDAERKKKLFIINVVLLFRNKYCIINVII